MIKNMTVGAKIAAGFGVVLVLVSIVGILGFRGVVGLVGNAERVIEVNELDSGLTQREVEHLNWANNVSELLTNDEVTELDVETDDHKCALGLWLYGDERTKAESTIPELKSILKQMEGPHADLHASAIDIGKHFVQADETLPGILANRVVDHLKWADMIRDCFLENCEAVKVEVDPTLCELGKWLDSEQAQTAYENGTTEMRRSWDLMVASHDKLHGSAKDISAQYVQRHTGLRHLLKDLLLDHKTWAEEVSMAIINGKSDLGVEVDHTKCAYGKFLASQACADYTKGFPELLEAIEASREPHKELHESAIAIGKSLAMGEAGKAEAEKVFQESTLPALAKVGGYFSDAIEAETRICNSQGAAQKIFDETTVPLLDETLGQLEAMKGAVEKNLAGMRKANEIFIAQTKPCLEKTRSLLGEAQEVSHAVAEEIGEETFALGAWTKASVGIVSIVAILIGIAVAFFIARGIINSLKRAVEALGVGAEEVASASAQISQSSQQLAEGSTQQASSLEESSSALEELSGQARGNTEGARKAEAVTNKTLEAIQTTSGAIDQMVDTMSGIKESSGKISGIIKTIEDIAFQTNLLALNAAVEAARAGEHGKGFAVVAEEVRNLAQRSAVAAKDTTALIESSVEQANKGVEVVEKAAESTKLVVKGSTEVGKNVAAIAVSSDEQSEGINQINEAVAQMDKVTQQVASNSEETASASEELAAQAVQMRSVVGDLEKLVGGKNGNHNGNGQSKRMDVTVGRSGGVQAHHPKGHAAHAAASTKGQTRAAAAIPFDDEKEHFEDF
jgi:methyl-accepting chemotaxis protein